MMSIKNQGEHIDIPVEIMMEDYDSEEDESDDEEYEYENWLVKNIYNKNIQKYYNEIEKTIEIYNLGNKPNKIKFSTKNQLTHTRVPIRHPDILDGRSDIRITGSDIQINLTDIWRISG